MVKGLFLLFLLLLPALACSSAPPGDEVLQYTLDVSFDVKASMIRGVAKIPVSKGQELMLQTGSLRLTAVSLGARELPVPGGRERIKVRSPAAGTIEIRYEGVFKEPPTGAQPSNIIGRQGIFLTGTWYPKPDLMCRYRLSAALPHGFEAVSEAESIEKTNTDAGTLFRFSFAHPVNDINFVATDRYVMEKDSFDGIEVFAYFFREDAALIPTYLKHAREYLKFYTARIGKFPYKRFSIVENFLPTGYSMPTYTLLGQQVVRLPFIPGTSLGHEILHQWFGNLVYIDYEKGNWAEGLTSFLADHLYEEKKGRGAEYRKNTLVNYMSYINDMNEFPLRQFRGKTDQATEAIGYGKAVMVYEMLKTMLGEDRFYRSMRLLSDERRFRKSSWDDVRHAFEKVYGNDLGWFFRQWIDGKGLAELRLEKIEVRPSGKNFTVAFDIVQGKEPFVLDVPVSVYFPGGKARKVLHVSGEKARFEVSTTGLPERIVIDEEYQVARRLSPGEFPPVIARLLGAEKRIAAVRTSDMPIYREVLETFTGRGDRIAEPDGISHADLKTHNLIVLGADNPLASRLYGSVTRTGGFSVLVKENPWNPRNVVGILDGRSRDEVEAAFPKIVHYGKYSTLSFDHGRNVSKSTAESARGIDVPVSKETTAVDISALKRLPAVIDCIASKKIVYVGEVHDRFSNHIVQLEIIKGLHKKGKKIAIGMEMFQTPFQKVLDDYIGGRIDERQFLKGAEYFKRWKFDYSLYRPILLFARAERIPVVALNQKQEIVDKVFRTGLGSLSADEKKWVPVHMDFSDEAYSERLKKVFHAHKGFEADRFDFFQQAQILWDETMAESVDRFLKNHSIDQMVVLAGDGHLAYGSGIPVRTAKRNGYDYAVVLNDSDVEPGIADFVLFPGSVPVPSAPVLMVILREGTLEGGAGKVEIQGFPKDSVSEKAGMRTGDVMLSIDNVPVRSIEDVKIELLAKKKGDKVKVRVLRKGVFAAGKEIDFEVTLH